MPSTTAVEELVLNPLLNVVVCSRDEVLVRFGIRSRFSHILMDEGRTGRVGPVVRAFEKARAAGVPAAETLAEIGLDDTAIDEATEFLRTRSVLVPASKDLGRVEMELLFDGDAPRDRVVLLGDARHGTEVRRQLERLPIGTVRSLPEEALSSDGPDGAAADALSALGTDTDGLLVVAPDSFRPALLHRVNEVMLELGGRWLPSIADGPTAIVGPVFTPHEGPCYAEFEIQFEATVALRDEYLLQKEQLVQNGSGRADGNGGPPPAGAGFATSPLTSALGGAWTAAWTMHALQGTAGFNPNLALILDYRELTVDFVEVLKLPRCPACNWGSPSYPRHLLF